MPIKVITPPAVEPVTLTEVMAQLRLDVDDEADLLLGYIQAAREDCEDFHGRSYVERTLEYVLDRFPVRDRIMLPRPPVQEILSVTYLDAGGAEHEFTDWLPAIDGPAVILKPGSSWPRVSLYPAGAVRVKYLSGYPANDIEIQHKSEDISETLTLQHGPIKGGSAAVFVDSEEAEDYTVNYDTGEVTFSSPPGDGVVTADYVQEATDPAGHVPWAVKAAILQTVATYYEHRESVASRGHVPMQIPGTAEDLLWKTRFFFNEEANS